MWLNAQTEGTNERAGSSPFKGEKIMTDQMKMKSATTRHRYSLFTGMVQRFSLLFFTLSHHILVRIAYFFVVCCGRDHHSHTRNAQPFLSLSLFPLLQFKYIKRAPYSMFNAQRLMLIYEGLLLHALDSFGFFVFRSLFCFSSSFPSVLWV